MLSSKKGSIATVLLLLIFGIGAKNASAQTSPSVLYVPLIGISSVPDPLALPNGPGNVTYHYAVKNFLAEAPLSNVQVNDDKCSPVKFVGGDDNGNSQLDFSETWRYDCTIKISETTQSVATAIGIANNLPAAHKAYATVIVGSNNLPPLVNIINITKVAYPLTLPSGGGKITFTYRVNNPGLVPLSSVSVTDDKCADMSGKLGDTNGNNLLDINEVWVYTCSTNLTETTTNTVSVTAYANSLKAVGYASITVTVANPSVQSSPNLPDTGTNPDLKVTVWEILAGVLAVLILFFVFTRKSKSRRAHKRSN
jgi:hypothetical protein